MTINNEHNKLNVPNLRFPEFQGEWEEHTLQDVVTFSNGKAHENSVNDDGDYILVNSKFVSTNGQVQKRVTSQLSPLHKSQFVMVMSDLPNGKALAKCFYVEEDNKYTLNQRVCSFTSNNGNVSRFLMYQINRNKYYLRFDDGINQTNLKKSEVLSCPVFIPIVREQEKIATLLCKIDERIATQNKIIDKLQSLIKGISSRIFTSIQGIEYRMGDIVTITNGNSNVQDAVTQSKDGLYPFFDRSEDIKYLPTFLFDKEAIIYPGEGTEFMPRYFNGKFALHQRCYAIFDFNEIINARFLYFYLKTRNSYFVKNAVGSTVPSLRLDTFQKLKVIIPSNKIQHSVSLCLSSMELKCNVEKKILHKLLKQKQYLLRQMFI